MTSSSLAEFDREVAPIHALLSQAYDISASKMPTQTFPRPALFRDYSAKTKAWIKAVNPDDPTARAVDQALALIAFSHLSPESFEISDSGAAETDSGLDPQRL